MANMVMFIILAVFILGSALVCVTTKRIMRAATFLLFVLFGVAFTLSSVAATTFVSSDGRFEYTLLEGNATLTKYLGEELISEIPSSLDGYRVVSLGKSAFQDKFRVPSSADDGVRIALSIPSTVTEIGDYAFSGCTRLESVTIPGSVKSIGAYAFKGCNGVNRVSFGEGLEKIGRSAFSCSGTTSIEALHGTLKVVFEALHGTLKVVFPSTLKDLGLAAFSGNQNLGEAVFLAPLEVTGDSAFVSCQYLTRVQFAEGQKEISEKMFRYCDELTEINFPGSLETIGDYSFERDGSLTAVSIPASVKTIGEYAFGNMPLRIAKAYAWSRLVRAWNPLGAPRFRTVLHFLRFPSLALLCRWGWQRLRIAVHWYR